VEEDDGADVGDGDEENGVGGAAWGARQGERGREGGEYQSGFGGAKRDIAKEKWMLA